MVQCPHSDHPPGLSDSETGCTGSPRTTPLCLTAAGLAKVDISVVRLVGRDVSWMTMVVNVTLFC